MTREEYLEECWAKQLTWREKQFLELALAMKLTPQQTVVLPAVFERLKKVGKMDDRQLFNKFHYSPATRQHAAVLIDSVLIEMEKENEKI